MAFIVTRNNKSGFVAFVEKCRVPVAGNKTTVRNVGYVCGLGVMTQSEFEEFKAWAHGITHQESRKAAVLACPRVVKKVDETTATIAEAQQKKTTVKKAPRAKKVVTDKEKQDIRTVREKEWLETLTPEQKTRYEERQTKKLRETHKETTKTIKLASEGIKFTGNKSNVEKKRIINERIKQLNLHIANTESDLRAAARRTESYRTPDWRVPDWKERVDKYQEAVKVLEKQKSGLRT